MDYPISVVTVCLVVAMLTVVSFVVIEASILTSISATIVIVLSACKTRLIMSYFMELRLAPQAWRLMYTSWIVAVVAIIVGGNYVAVLSSRTS